MQPDYNYNPTNPTYDSPQQAVKRMLIVAGTLIAAIVIIWVTWSQVVNKHTVTFQPKSGTGIQIGTVKHDDNGDGIQTVLAQTPQQQSIRLKPGDYMVQYSGKDYIPQYKRIHVDSDMVLITPALSYNDDKLKNLLAQETSSIHNAIATTVNMSIYTPQNERLFYDGTWYATQLMPNDTNVYDPQVLVAHKVNGTWKIAAGPKISIYKGDYPNIPEEILRTINNIPVSINPPADATSQ